MVFFIPLTGFCFYMAFLYPQAAQEERLIFLAGVFMFGGLVAFAVYRIFYLELIWTEYDMENVIFHYSRKEELRSPAGFHAAKAGRRLHDLPGLSGKRAAPEKTPGVEGGCGKGL